MASPGPNSQSSGSQNQFFGEKVSRLGINVNNAADSQLLYKFDYSTQTFYDQTGIARILIGLLPDGTYGIVISQPGFNVNSLFT